MLGSSVIVLAGSAWFGWELERTQGPPERFPVAIGFASSDTLAEQPPGYAVAVWVDVRGCKNPAHVTVTVAGTADLWRLHKRRPEFRLPARSAIAVGVTDRTITRLRLVPVYGDASRPSPADSVTRVPFSVAGFHRGPSKQQGPTPTKAAREIVGFFDHWERTWWAVAATFDADWVSPRDFESCYVRLPALTGLLADPGSGSAGDAVSGKGAGPVVTSFGSTRLVGDGRVASELSIPPPNEAPTSTWTCQDAGPPGGGIPGDLSPASLAFKHGNGALSLRDDRRAEAVNGGCDAVAVVERPDRSALRDLLLLVAGAGIALGMSLVAEVAVRPRASAP
jgi:hypothetical protein